MSAHAVDRVSLSVSSIAFPISVLGPGDRVVLWVQGCGIGCPGCASRDTWDETAGESVPVVELGETLAAYLAEPGCAGLSISGGEPLDQPESLALLLSLLRGRLRDDQDILLFTGRSAAHLRDRHPDVVRLVDAAVAGPYQEAHPSNLLWRSSGNQELLIVSDRGRDTYRTFVDARDGARLQVIEDEGRLTIVGLPRPGDLERLRTRLADHGIRLDQPSWDGSVETGGAIDE